MTKSPLWKSDVERLHKLVFAGHHVLTFHKGKYRDTYEIASISQHNPDNPFIFFGGQGYTANEIRQWKGFEFLDPFPDGEST
jgi:hypothetical protein